MTTVADGVARITWVRRAPGRRADARRRRRTPRGRGGAGGARPGRGHGRARRRARQRVATWSGLRREGVMRGVTVDGDDRRPHRLRAAGQRPAAARAGGLPRAAQLLPPPQARDQPAAGPRPTTERVLLCQLTYKRDWDLPGGVVEVGESPQLAVGPRGRGGARRSRIDRRRPAADRLAAAVGRLGRRALPGLRRRRARRRRSLDADRRAGPRDPARGVLHASTQVRERCADFTARRIAAAAPAQRPAYAERQRPTPSRDV